MITIEEFLKSKGLGGYQQFDKPIKELIGIYVQEALKQASEQAKIVADDRQDFRFQSCNCLDYVLDKDSILNAYPLTNIK